MQINNLLNFVKIYSIVSMTNSVYRPGSLVETMNSQKGRSENVYYI